LHLASSSKLRQLLRRLRPRPTLSRRRLPAPAHCPSDLLLARTFRSYPPPMLGVSIESLEPGPEPYRQAIIRRLSEMPHPRTLAPFHTMAVKWPTTPRAPLLHPGIRPQSLTSLYHMPTDLFGPAPIARFSPAGPPSAALSLYDWECFKPVALLKYLCVLEARASFQTSGGAPCIQRNLLCSLRSSHISDELKPPLA
jgi:hypothetical protein